MNEGPSVLEKNGRIFLTYSASATDENYCLGMLVADADADLLSAKSWRKMPRPVFGTSCSAQTALEAILMVFAPALVNKIGAKRGLLLFGFLTFVRIAGSAFFTDPIALSGFRLIAAFEYGKSNNVSSFIHTNAFSM